MHPKPPGMQCPKLSAALLPMPHNHTEQLEKITLPVLQMKLSCLSILSGCLASQQKAGIARLRIHYTLYVLS